MAKPTITVAEYLIRRLKELGAEHLFAVPGDYAGPFLSVVDKTKEITRVGVTNEWVAGYAADSYARLRGDVPHLRRGHLRRAQRSRRLVRGGAAGRPDRRQPVVRQPAGRAPRGRPLSPLDRQADRRRAV